MSSANGADPSERVDNARRYTLTWQWRVAKCPLEYSQELFKAWMRKKLPLRSLRVQANVAGRVTVVAVVSAPSSRAAITQWFDFPLRAITERRLDAPDCLSVSTSPV